MKRQREQEEDAAALSALEQRQETAREDAKRRRLAEHQLRRSRQRGDPNNPTKEEMDAQQVINNHIMLRRWGGLVVSVPASRSPVPGSNLGRGPVSPQCGLRAAHHTVIMY